MSLIESIEAFAAGHALNTTSSSPDEQSNDGIAYDTQDNSSFFAASGNHPAFPAVANENDNGNQGNDEHYNQDMPLGYDPSLPELGQNPNAQISDTELRRLILTPWTPESRQQFHQKFNSLNPLYKNKLRLSPHAEARVRHFVLHPTSPIDHRWSSDARLKLRSKTFTLHPFNAKGRLYRIDSGAGTPLRRHVNNDEVWDMITSEHMRSGHKGRDKMLHLIKERFIGYTLDELMFVLYECRVCQRARSHGTGANAKDAAIDFSNRMKASLRTIRPDVVDMYNPGGEGTVPVTVAASSRTTDVGTSSIEVDVEIADVESDQNARGIASLVGASFVPPQQHMVTHSWSGQLTGSRNGYERRKDRFSPNDYGLVEYDYPDWYDG